LRLIFVLKNNFSNRTAFFQAEEAARQASEREKQAEEESARAREYAAKQEALDKQKREIETAAAAQEVEELGMAEDISALTAGLEGTDLVEDAFGLPPMPDMVCFFLKTFSEEDV
jgi:hypothetical protein